MFDTRRRYALSLALCAVLALPSCGGGGSDAAGTTAPQGSTTTDSTPPSPPGTLTLLSLTGDSARLSWGAASDDAGVTGYDILRNAQVVGSTSGEVLSFTDTGLVRGNAYTYTVRARDAAGNWSAPSVGLVATPGSGVVADTQAPSVPTGLKLDGATQNSLSLSWQASSDNLAVTRYELYRDGALLTTLSANTRSYVNTGLSALTSYRYAVLARDAAGNASALSASLSAATLGQVAQDVQAPTAPTGLTVSSVGASALTLSWQAASDNVGVTVYEVLRAGIVIASVGGSALSHPDTDLAPATAYRYTVRARDAAGNSSAESAPLLATTAPVTTAPDTQAPSTPAGLSAASTASSVQLNWEAANDNVGVTGYEVFRNNVSIGSTSSPSYTDTGLLAATVYAYSVRARDAAANWSSRSTSVSVTTAVAIENPPPPSNPGTPQYTTAASRTLGGATFEWSFNCGGRACRYGRFVNGDIWVAPIDDLGKRVSAVTLTGIKPDGVQHGAEANPSSATHHGILTYESSYEASRNVMTKLPYAAVPGTSIFKAFVQGTSTECRNSLGCVASDDVLTVLSDPPENDGSTVFRPPFHGSQKPLFSTSKLRLSRLSSLPYLSANLFKKESFAKQAAAIAANWSVPVHIIAHTNGNTDLYRTLSPINVQQNYGAHQAGAFNGAVRALLGSESTLDKQRAVYALLQKGIDVYGVLRADIPLGSGAGQHLGQKPALAFFAALYDDPAILAEVRATASNPDLINRGFFQEDTQVERSLAGVPIWGEPGEEKRYWAAYFDTWAELHLDGPGARYNGAHGDPYRYIDGPGGGMSGNKPHTRNYHPVAAPYLADYAFTQMLMPWYRHAANDSELHEYADRLYGYAQQGFPGGYWSRPDECAGADDRETLACSPWELGAGCQYYKVTWGPDPKAPGKCILYSGNPHTTHGRWPESHGIKVIDTPGIWTTQRACLDKKSASYNSGNCQGLGPAP